MRRLLSKKQRNNVVFPVPFFPLSAQICPAWTERLTGANNVVLSMATVASNALNIAGSAKDTPFKRIILKVIGITLCQEISLTKIPNFANALFTALIKISGLENSIFSVDNGIQKVSC